MRWLLSSGNVGCDRDIRLVQQSGLSYGLPRQNTKYNYIATASRLRVETLSRLSTQRIGDSSLRCHSASHLCTFVVLNQGDLADHTFLLVSDSGRYVFFAPSGRRLLLIWLLPGDLVGGSALLEKPLPYLCGVELAKSSSVLVW